MITYQEKRKQTKELLARGLERVQQALAKVDIEDKDFHIAWFKTQERILKINDESRQDFDDFCKKQHAVSEAQYQKLLRFLKSKQSNTSEFEKFHSRQLVASNEWLSNRWRQIDDEMAKDLYEIDERIDLQVEVQLKMVESRLKN